MSNAPYCPISQNQQKGTAQQPRVDIAHVTTARDLPSVITAINQMNNIVQHITRGTPQINNVRINVAADPPVPPPQYARYTWSERSRSYNRQRITNPDDKTQYVDIKTLSSIEWVENMTGHTLEYRSRK